MEPVPSPVLPRRPGASQAPAVTRAVAILRLLSERPEPLGVSAIAREVGLIPSTCLHILRALADEGLVRDAGGKRYGIGPEVLNLARPFLRQRGFGRAVQPGLERIAREFGLTAIGMRVFGLEHLVVVALAHGHRPWQLHVDLGDLVPALTSATGRCVAAFGGFSREALAEAFPKARWENPPPLAVWFKQVEEARRRGYAVDAGNFMRGVLVLSAPVTGDGGALRYVVTVCGIREQIEEHGVEKVASSMLALAADVAGRIEG